MPTQSASAKAKTRTSFQPKPRQPRAPRLRGVQVRLIRAIHERLSSGHGERQSNHLHLPVNTCGEVEKVMGDSARVRFVPDPDAEPLHPPQSPLSPRLAGDRVVAVTCVVSRAILREV